jgi:hypothetical protein
VPAMCLVMEQKVEPKDYITTIGVFLSAGLVVAGWIFNRYKDREQEKFKSRNSRREELVKAFLEFDLIVFQTSGNIAKEPTYRASWMKLVSLMNLYGTAEENRELLRFHAAFLGEGRSPEAATAARTSLVSTLLNSIRADLGLEKLDSSAPPAGRIATPRGH